MKKTKKPFGPKQADPVEPGQPDAPKGNSFRGKDAFNKGFRKIARGGK